MTCTFLCAGYHRPPINVHTQIRMYMGHTYTHTHMYVCIHMRAWLLHVDFENWIWAHLHIFHDSVVKFIDFCIGDGWANQQQRAGQQQRQRWAAAPAKFFLHFPCGFSSFNHFSLSVVALENVLQKRWHFRFVCLLAMLCNVYCVLSLSAAVGERKMKSSAAN